MDSVRSNYQKIYEHLGQLFYAIAAGDNTVKPVEIQRLKDLVNEKWLPLEGTVDEFSTDAAHYILIVFDYLLDQNTSAEAAFHIFEEYYKDNRDEFTATLKRRISETSIAIAHSFAGANQSELKFLTQLHNLMTDNNVVNQIHG